MSAGTILVLAAALATLLIYNRLVRMRLRVREAWSGVDVQLKRRADVVPNLVEAVKAYAAHERALFVMSAVRAVAMSSPDGSRATGPTEFAERCATACCIRARYGCRSAAR